MTAHTNEVRLVFLSLSGSGKSLPSRDFGPTLAAAAALSPAHVEAVHAQVARQSAALAREAA